MTVPQILKRLDGLRRLRAAPGARVSATGGRLEVVAARTPRHLPLTRLRALAKTVGRHHRTARALWDTGHADARLLATMVEESALVEDEQLDRWIETAGEPAVIDRVCLELVVATPWARSKVGDWAHHPQPLVRRAAYVMLRALARTDAAMTNADFIPWVDGIPSAASRENPLVREAMVAALSSIGERNDALRARVLGATGRIRRLAATAERAPRLVLRAPASDWRRVG